MKTTWREFSRAHSFAYRMLMAMLEEAIGVGVDIDHVRIERTVDPYQTVSRGLATWDKGRKTATFSMACPVVDRVEGPIEVPLKMTLHRTDEIDDKFLTAQGRVKFARNGGVSYECEMTKTGAAKVSVKG